jgi:hypothetical protein
VLPVAMKRMLTTMPARTCITASMVSCAGKRSRSLLPTEEAREVTRPERLQVAWEKSVGGTPR